MAVCILGVFVKVEFRLSRFLSPDGLLFLIACWCKVVVLIGLIVELNLEADLVTEEGLDDGRITVFLHTVLLLGMVAVN